MKIKKNELFQILFFVAYFLILSNYFMNRVTFLNDIINYFKYCGVGILLLLLLIQSSVYKKSSILKILALSIIALMTYFRSGSDVIILLFLLFFTMRNIDFEKLVKHDMIYRIILIISLFILYKCGLTNEYTLYRDGIQRYSFGFKHPNIFGFVMSSVILDLIYLKRDKIKKVHIIPILISVFIIDYYADSRSSAMLLITSLILCFVNKKKLEKIVNYKFVKKIVTNSWFIFTIVSLILAFLYYKNTTLGISFNDILNTRFYHIVNYFNNYDINLFGNNMLFISSETAEITGQKSAILDNTFVHYLLNFGLIAYLVIGIYIRKTFVQLYNEKKTVLIGILFLIMIYSIVENRINITVFTLLLGKNIYNNIGQ